MIENILVASWVLTFFVYLIQGAELFTPLRAKLISFLDYKIVKGESFAVVFKKWLQCPFCLSFVLSWSMVAWLGLWLLPVTAPVLVNIFYKWAFVSKG